MLEILATHNSWFKIVSLPIPGKKAFEVFFMFITRQVRCVYTCKYVLELKSPVNIYSHLIGAIVIAYGPLYSLGLSKRNIEIDERLAIDSFFLGVATCFILSTLYFLS